MAGKRRISNEEEGDGVGDGDAEQDMTEDVGEDDEKGGEDEGVASEAEGRDEEDENESAPAAAETSPPSAKRRRQESPPRSGPRPLNRPGEFAQVGIIQQIKVENFMCHRKLRVDLCRNINFIHGQNGSGKSAILAALQICLGAGARRTHRARNLKGLVRQDHSHQPTHAKLSVTVRNQGEDAYKHDEYGDKITVERTIALKSGAYNGYMLYDENGKEVSRSRKDLDEMLDHLNIQVENPVAILDQEEAKKFLTGKAEDKYKFFMKACELERLDQAYAKTADDLVDCRDAEERIADRLAVEHLKVSELKKEYDQHRELSKLQSQAKAQECKLAWALWKEKDEELKQAKKKMKEFQEKAEKKREELTQAEKLSQESMEGQDHVSKRVKELEEEAQQLSSQFKVAQVEYVEASKPLKLLQNKLKALEKRLSDAQKELKASEKRLSDVREQIANSNKDAEVERLREAQRKAEEKLAACREKEDSMKQQTADLLRIYEEHEPRVLDAKRGLSDLKRQYESMEYKLSELEQSSGDTLAMFGRNVKGVKSEIDRRRNEFRGPVVGPIGSYLKIQPGKEEYAPLAELHIGSGMLDRFIVTNGHDRRIVQSIRDKYRCHNDCGIFQMSPSQGRFSVPPSPVTGIETVATVLRVEDDLVFNCLVDNSRIDQIALAKDRQKSEEALIYTNNGEKAIKGIIKQVYCFPKGDMWNIRNGQQAVISNEKPLKRTIGADKTAAIVQMKRDLEEKQVEVRNAQRETDRLDGEHSECQRRWNVSKKALIQNSTMIEKLSDQIEQINIEIDNTTGNTIDTSEYEADVEQQKDNVEKLRGEQEQAIGEIEEMKPQVSEMKTAIRNINNQIEKARADLEAAESEMTKFLETQSQRKDVVAKKKDKIAKYDQAIEMHAEKIALIQNECDDKLFKARNILFRYNQRKSRESRAQGDALEASQDYEDAPEPTHDELEAMTPIDVDKDVDYYQKKLEKMKERIEKERQRRSLADVDESEAYKKYFDAKQALSAKLELHQKLKDQIAEYETDLKNRRKRWKHFRKHLEHKTSEKFQELLLMNKYNGELVFDHETSHLDLSVQKQNTSASQSNDVKGLSGGERSYTTISLLLSLGESLETPFRVMDEFDVFLDPQVRKLTIRALIHTAKKLQHRQFIFITPQDLTGIDPDPQLKIFKLNPPDRYNSVGPSQQTLNLSQA